MLLLSSPPLLRWLLLTSPRPITHFQKYLLASFHRSEPPVKDNGPFSWKDNPYHLPPTQIDRSSSHTDAYNLVKLLNASAKSLAFLVGQQTHGSAIKLGFCCSNIFVATSVVDMYCKCKRISDARKLFDGMLHRNVVAWNAMIHGYSKSYDKIFAVEFFVEMIRSGVRPSPFSVSSVLVACGFLRAVEMGITVHCVGLKLGLCSNVVVGTALVDVYAKCVDVEEARRVFEEMEDRNVVTWTSLINGYAEHQRPDEAMLVAKNMSSSGIKLNAVTYTTLLSSFSKLECLVYGRQVHSLVIREDLETHPYVSTALRTMYSKCGASEDFAKIALIKSTRDQISCNSVIAGFSHLGNASEVVSWFVEMRREHVPLDHFTFASLLSAIGTLSALEEGKQTHALVLKTGFCSTTCVQNGLVSMYARCGAVADSRIVFSSMKEPDLVSWNSLLAGYAQHGHGKEAIELFENMRRHKAKPDSTTFLCVLSSCSHVGYIDKGLEYFELMKEHQNSSDPITTTPGIEHYACVVDLLGRAGFLKEAESFIKNMPIKPGASVYRSLLSACKVHDDMEMAMRVAEHLVELCPNDSATYVLLSNVFAGQSCWDNAAMVHKLMSERGIKKKPGWSRI